MMSYQEAIRLATEKILPPGYKPEDYFIIGSDVPMQIAYNIVKEAQFILEHEKYLLRMQTTHQELRYFKKYRKFFF